MSIGAIPAPPTKPSKQLPPLGPVDVPELWRLHWEADVTKPTVHKPGRWRFDAPDGEYAVSYGNVSANHAFVEVYGDTDGPGEIGPNQADRRLSSIQPTRPLYVVDLGDAGVLQALGIDLRLATEVDYARTQLWGERIHAWWPSADAIRFPGRKAGRMDNYCLFLDRCESDIHQTFHGTIAQNERRVLEVCELFSFVPRVLFEPAGPLWP